MHLEKLVTVLKAFDEERIKRLKDYVNSPYFKITPVAALLLERLSRLHPRYPTTKMQPKILGRKDHRLCTASKQSNAGSFLLRAIEQFIAQEEWQKNEAEMTRLQLKGLQDLSLFDEYEKGFSKQMANLNDEPTQNPDALLERHLLTELSLNGFKAKLKRSAQNDIMPIVKTLDEFYALKKLRYLCEAINRNQFFGTEFLCSREHTITLIKILEPLTNDKHPYVYLFVNVFRMIEEDSFDESNLYYQLLKQYIERHKNFEPSQSIREAVDYAINYCLRWNNKGYKQAGKEYLWWIEWKANNNLLLQDTRILPVTFRNVVRVAVSSKTNPEWINRWISIYGPSLPKEHYETNIAFARGLHQYTLKNYLPAIRYFLLAQAKEEVLFNGSVRMWEWMCLYEYNQNDIEALSNHLFSFEKYLVRNKRELQHLPKIFELFIAYAFKLIDYSKSDATNSFVQNLQNEQFFSGKSWLLEQFSAKSKKTRARGARVQNFL